MGETTVTLNFKQLNIIKHSLLHYIQRRGALSEDKLEEFEVLEEVKKVLDTMYPRRNNNAKD